MSLVDFDEQTDFDLAFQELGYKIKEQNPTELEIEDTFEEIFDEFSTTLPDKGNDLNGLYLEEEVDDEYLEPAQAIWDKASDNVLNYVNKHYQDDIYNNFTVNTYEDLEEVIVSHLARGMQDYAEDLAGEGPLLSPEEEEEYDQTIKAIKQVLEAGK